jgi:hypothetical protein
MLTWQVVQSGLLHYFHELFRAIIYGVPSYILVHGIIKLLQSWFVRTERTSAVLLHYQLQRRRIGHAGHVLKCSDGKCVLL